MPDLKALMCVKLREKNQECGNFLKMCCALLKIGVFDENYITACYILSLNLQLINFMSSIKEYNNFHRYKTIEIQFFAIVDKYKEILYI